MRKMAVVVISVVAVVGVMAAPAVAADLDTSWGTSGVALFPVPADTRVADTVPLPDGRIVVVGSQEPALGPWQEWGIVVSADGTAAAPLTGYPGAATRFTAVTAGGDRIYAIGERDDGVGTSTVVAVFDSTGAYLGGSNISFDEQTIPTSAAVDGQGRLFVAGYAAGGNQRAWVDRRTAAGAVDPAFATRFLETTSALAANPIAYVGVSVGQVVAVVTEADVPAPGALIRFHRITEAGSVFMADFSSARTIVAADIDSSTGHAVFGSLTPGASLTDSNYLIHRIDSTGVPIVTSSNNWIDVAGRIEVSRLRTDELLGAGEGDVNTFVELVQTSTPFAGRSDSELVDIATSPVDGGVYVTSVDVPGDDLVIGKYEGDESGRFIDDDSSVHETNIERLEELGVTRGCNPPVNDRYCPSSNVTRGQMAAFLSRALALPPAPSDYFTDDDGSIFESDINAVAQAGITLGCNPPTNDNYCPAANVTRGQMAAFLKRAFALPSSGTDFFVDDAGSVFEADINAIAEAGITLGCNPPTNDRYCPADDVTREQMASFLVRAIDG